MGENELKIYHNIEHEKKLIELLGYNLIGPDNSNRWKIVDDNNIDVGFIQYKKLYSGNKRKGFSKSFEYHMEICSNAVNYNSTRKVLNKNDDESLDTSFFYEFDIKRENGKTDQVNLNLGKYSGLRIWSEKYGYIDFNLNNGLFLNFKSVTENFNIEEVVSFDINNREKSKEYTYQISYYNKEQESLGSDLQKVITRAINGKTCSQYKSNQIKLSERTWINHKLEDSKENEIIGTIEDMIVNHQMGIDAFNHFRFLISKILPFKQDIIDIMVKEGKINKNIMSMFISNDKKEEIPKELVKK